MNLGDISKILIFGFISFSCYSCGRAEVKEEFEELDRLAREDTRMVYLDILNVLHADKDCWGLRTWDDAGVGRKGVKFIEKKTVNCELVDTVSICARCVSNKEYDRLHKGFYLSEKARDEYIRKIVDRVFAEEEKKVQKKK